MAVLPKDGGTFWLQYNGLDLEVVYSIYEDHVYASTSYYYWDDDSIIGIHEEPFKGKRGTRQTLIIAIKKAIKDLLLEMESDKLKVWHSEHPDTKQKAVINFFGLTD